MTRALVALLLASCACSATPLQRKEMAIQSALDAAYLACQTGLNDPAVTWDVGAREWCERLLDGCRETGRP